MKKNVIKLLNNVMKQLPIILTVILFGCSARNEYPNNESSETIQPAMRKQSKFLLTQMNDCHQTNLSTQFDISINFKRYTDTIVQQDSCFFTVYLYNKSTKSLIDSFFIASSFISSEFANCDNMTSYTTKFKADREIVDNYFGDIVVADLNFDGNDDIAVINDCGGNGGPLYSYYIQTSKKKFILDSFLTDSMVFFPSEINSKNKTLTTYVHIGVCGLSEDIYKFNKTKKSWTKKSSKYINVCE